MRDSKDGKAISRFWIFLSPYNQFSLSTSTSSVTVGVATIKSVVTGNVTQRQVDKKK
jgi:K+-sensing histidine kinase KdpD